MPEFIKVAKMSELADGAAACVEAGGKRIALFNVGGEICAIEDTCTHAGGPLSEGTVVGDEVECPWHGARFKLKTGEAVSPPAPQGVARFNVRVSGDDIEVQV
jgi:3-phenylpropionate/trans-cinnamate dioxygenase ferredoxin subunit